MEIVLVRHGEPEWVRDGLNVDNPPLTERGHRQAAAMAEVACGGSRFDEVFCSPLDPGPSDGCAAVRAARVVTETIDPWLEEIRNPIWHGTPAEKADEAYPEERSRPSSDRWRGLDELGGEHVGEFVARIRQGCGLFLGRAGDRAGRGRVRGLVRCRCPIYASRSVAHAGTNAVVDLPPARAGTRHRGSGTASCSTTRRSPGSRSMPLGDGHTFCLHPALRCRAPRRPTTEPSELRSQPMVAAA